jgi:glycosyltransferase involved in cell wall biosynthesis
MEKLSHRFLSEMRRRRRVIAVVKDCRRVSLAPLLAYAGIRLVLELAFRRRRIALVHFGDPLVAWCAPACAVFRVPSLITVHGLDVTFGNPLYRRLTDVSLHCADRLVCISAAAREACLQRGIPAERLVIIHPGVDPPRGASREAAREVLAGRFGLQLRDGSVLLTVGRLVRRKGVAWFVENVVPLLRESETPFLYLVVGSGPDRGQIRQATDRLGLGDRVRLMGQVSDEDLALFMAAADIFVMPNVRVPGDMEGFGLVALEAAACGLPVIASDVEGIREAITNGENGILMPAGDAPAFAREIVGLVRDSERRLRLGERAAAYTWARHSWSRMADEYERLYDEMAAAFRSAGFRSRDQEM